MQNGFSVQKALNEQVMKRLQTTKEGLVNFSDSNGDYGIMMRRDYEDYEEQIQRAVYAGSYLAKTHTKEYNAKGARFSSASRLPRQNAKDNSAYLLLFLTWMMTMMHSPLSCAFL